MKRLRLKLLLPVLVALVLVWYFQRGRVPEVRVIPAQVGTAVDAVTGSAKVFAMVDIRVKCERPGLLVEAPLEPGNIVNEGDLVAVQDSTELQAQLNQARVRLEAAEKKNELPSYQAYELQVARESLEQVRAAVELGQMPPVRLEEAQDQVKMRESILQYEQVSSAENLAVLREEVARLEAQVELMTTRIPFGGKIVEKFAWPGARLHGNADLVRLVSHGRFVELTVSEEDYAGVEVGQPVTLRLASYPGRSFQGSVWRLDPVANADAKTRKVYVTVEADDETLVPGLTGEGYLVKGEQPEAIIVPRRALVGNRVWVVTDGSVELRTVETGYMGLLEAEVRSGLEAGETVVLEEQMQLRDGQRVRALVEGE